MKNHNYINTVEDTLWLSELTTDFLKAAVIWPYTMMKLVHVFGVLSSLLGMIAFTQSNYVIAVIFITCLGACFYKGSDYVADIKLISNELERRNKELK